ncbi:hypothetical protein FDA94_28700 [Herbidospora galbida]|uniref:Uncharacterized protein n=1 Tax=Herbidospora galbida TaxID=2575442 RepID=A0A4U3M727_9ACTN|nr:hypothetical protein [Herbidospora galbida]TKK84611.1 hypothetical protein FDA94_28700 [Herbidospora galbida]
MMFNLEEETGYRCAVDGRDFYTEEMRLLLKVRFRISVPLKNPEMFDYLNGTVFLCGPCRRDFEHIIAPHIIKEREHTCREPEGEQANECEANGHQEYTEYEVLWIEVCEFDTDVNGNPKSIYEVAAEDMTRDCGWPLTDGYDWFSWEPYQEYRTSADTCYTQDKAFLRGQWPDGDHYEAHGRIRDVFDRWETKRRTEWDDYQARTAAHQARMKTNA